MQPVSDWIDRLICGRYELRECIYSSRMSNVFRAWDHKKECVVAVKIATNNLKYSNLVGSLKREAIALGRFNNPRVVRLLDFGTIGESFFIVMEYVRGWSLADHLDRDGQLPLAICISMGIQILEGLKVIHSAGLIHCDLKPDNLMVTPDGIKIIDFGVVRFASAVDQKMNWTNDNSKHVTGTLPYLSPEQGQARFKDFDGRTDLYACGVVLYELMTGVYPFYEFEKEDQILGYWKQPLRPFSEVWPPVDVPKKIRKIVWKALEVDSGRRYQTAEEMRADLLAV